MQMLNQFAIAETLQIAERSADLLANLDFGVVQLGGLEPPTFGATIRRSNQLSYSCMSMRVGRDNAQGAEFRPAREIIN